MEQRNLDAPRVESSEWMHRENKVSNMISQSTSDMSSDDDHLSDLFRIQPNRDRFDPAVTKQTYDIDGGTFVNIIPHDQRGAQVHSEPTTNYLKRKYDDRFNDPVKNQQVGSEINFKNMRQSENNAKNWIDNLIKKQCSMLQATPYFSANEVVSEVQFQDDQDSDNDASLAILDGPRQSADNLLESSVHDRNTEGTLIEAPIDQLHLREASSINHLAIPTRSRRNRNEIDLDEVKRTDLNTDNLFTETFINRMRDLTAQRNAGESETLSRPSERDIDVAANRRSDDSGMGRNDRKTVDFEDIKQTHLDDRNIYALDNRSRGTNRSESTVDYLFSESEDNFNVANESTNSYTSYVGTIAINTVANNFVSTASIEDQVEMDEISEIENRTAMNLNTEGTEISTIDCRDSACSESSVNDNVTVFRAKKYGRTKELSRKNKGHFAQVDVSTISVNDNSTNIDVVDSEAPFTGFKGSQKFPIKFNHKSRSELSQVEKFDRRHFGPRKDRFEETSTYPNTMLFDLPKSPSRDVLHRHQKTDDGSDVGMNEENDKDEEMIERNEKRNDTFDESWLLDMTSTDVKSSTEKLATTPNVTYSDFENVTKKDKDDSDGRVEIDVTEPSMRPIEKTNITILGLFEMTYGSVSRPEGGGELQAAKLAVERVNESDVLKRFRLRLIYNDTKVSWLISKVNVVQRCH